MFEAVQFADDGLYYRSTLLSGAHVPHVFSTRRGGVSSGPFASMNLGNPNGQPVQDSLENIAENQRRLLDACQMRGQIVRVHQVHGKVLAFCRPGEAFDHHQQADAIINTDPLRLASVRVADCVPILISHADGKCVAAVHAGWRGVVGGILPETLRALQTQNPNTRPNQWLIAIGPCISASAFEVGGEVVEQFASVFGAAAGPWIRRVGDKGHIDLRQALVHQARETKVPLANIDCCGHCTYANPRDYFSHRRERGLTGRMMALIAPRSQ